MKVNYPGTFDGNLRLGVGTNKGLTEEMAHWLAQVWGAKVKRIKSYKILKFTHTDYHRRPVDEETGYASVTVAYFSRLDEGTPTNRDIGSPPSRSLPPIQGDDEPEEEL